MNKKVLIITNEMIPYSLSWGGCQRMFFLSKALVESGNHVDLIALRSSSYNTFGREPYGNCFYVEGKREKTDTENAIKVTKKKSSKFAFVKLVVRKIDDLLFNEIQAGNGMKTFLRCRKAKKIIRELLNSQEYDIALISGPPFEIFSLAKVVKKYSKCKLVIDYRDPWNMWHPGNLWCEYKEKRIQTLADKIVCTNSNLCKDMSVKNRIDSGKYEVAANGFSNDFPSEEEIEQAQLEKEKLNFIYAGSISFANSSQDYRNPYNLLRAFYELTRKGIQDIHITFVGVNLANVDYSSEIIKKLKGYMTLLGPVNSTMAKAYIANADVGILIHNAKDQSGRYLISGKAYDYIQMKKYMLSVGRADSQHADILESKKIGMNSTNEVTDIVKTLENIYELWKSSGFQNVYDNIDVNEFSRDHQIDNYLKILYNL